MEFVRPTLSSQVLPAAAVEEKGDGEEVLVAGWPVARQHPRGQDGTVFVTIEDETGDVQLILWPRVFARCRRVLGNQVILARGKGLPVGRHYQCSRVERGANGCEGLHARRPRLALNSEQIKRRNYGFFVTEMPPKWDN